MTKQVVSHCPPLQCVFRRGRVGRGVWRSTANILARQKTALDVSLGWGGILIIIDGGVQIEDVGDVAKTAAIAFASQKGGTFIVTADAEGSRFVVLSGAQLHQEVYAHGPLMMASQQSLQKAYDVVSKLRL
jgi:redox-sensitive bicupin YhaK (pirin superfamily)